MGWLTRISLHNRSIVGLLVVAIVLVGAYAVTTLKQELIPDLTFPYLTVITVDPTASATAIEQTITGPLEQAIKTTSGIKQYTSFSNAAVSIITIEYQFGTDMNAKKGEVQQAVSQAQALLPATAQAPQVAALNIASMPVVQLAVSSPLPPHELADLLGTVVVPRLQTIEGVQAVTLSGMQQMQLQIKLRPERLAALGVDPARIAQTVLGANLTTGAGSVTSGSLVYPITVSAKAQTARAIENLVLPATETAEAATAVGGAMMAGTGVSSLSPTAVTVTATDAPASSRVEAQTVRLGDVADVRIVPAALTAVTRTNGQPSVGISVSKTASGNTVEIANAVADEIARVSDTLGDKVVITTVIDQSVFIQDSIRSLIREGVIGAAFAVIVIWLFLFNWRPTIIAGFSIPLSVLGALIVLWSRGESLNMLTLGGLTIAIGRVIDDSIVVIENTFRHLQEGDSIRSAAYSGTREVAGAITASTLTTVAVFLPLGLIQGLASEFFRPFALTVSFALLSSLAVALVVVPVLATRILTKRAAGHRDAAELSRLQNVYLPALTWALGHRTATLLAALAVFLGSVALTPLLKTNLFDSSGQNTVTVTQTLPPGTSLDATMAAARKIEAVLADTAGIETYQVTGGSTGSLFGAGGGTSASSSQATFSITTNPHADKTVIIDDIRARVGELRNAGTITVTGDDSSTMGGASLIEVQVSAADPEVLTRANDMVLERMRGIEGLTNVTSNLSEGRPSATIVVDQAKAAAAGVTPAALAQYMTLILSGYPLGTVNTVAGPLSAQITLGEISVPPLPGAVSRLLRNVPVAGAAGMVPLEDIANVVELRAPVQVTHVNGARTASVTATSLTNNIGAASADVRDALINVELPAGATWELAGATQMVDEVFSSLGIAMLIAILLVYLIMVATFRSLVNPLILLISIPFAAVGAIIALLVTDTALGMPSMVGLLMLIGIVVTNAIVFLDLVEQFRRRGMDARTAVIEGGRRRLRPILMTAVATILALIPMALGFGGESGFLSTPLAIVVIGGLFSSTFLTLILVPVIYVSVSGPRQVVDDGAAATSLPSLPTG